MRFSKETRALIYEKAPLPVTITWPASTEPRKGKAYWIQAAEKEEKTRPQSGDDRLIVDDVFDLDVGWEASVKLELDPVRHLRVAAKRVGEDEVTELEPEQVPLRYQRLLQMEADQKNAMSGAIARQQAKVQRAEEKVRKARFGGGPTDLAQGRLDRAKKRLDDLGKPEAHKPIPSRRAATRTSDWQAEPEPPVVSVDQVVDALYGRGTAQDVATRLGFAPRRLRRVVLALNQAREEGRVICRVDTEGAPIARWSVV